MIDDEPGFSLTLAGKPMAFHPLTLRQTKRIMPLYLRLSGLSGGSVTEANLDEMIEIVAIAGERRLETSEPFTVDALLSLPITMAELLACLPIVGAACGLQMSSGPNGPNGAAPLAVATAEEPKTSMN